MTRQSSFVLLVVAGAILTCLPEFSIPQQTGNNPPRFSPDSRPNMMVPTSSTPVPLEIEKQLESIAQQQAQLEEMKRQLVQQLDKFRDEYRVSMQQSSTSNSIILSTLRPTTTPTTPESDRTTTRLMEIKESFLEVEVKSPPVLIIRTENKSQLARN